MFGQIDDMEYFEPPTPTKPPLICDECECGLYSGDEYYDIDGKIFCSGCILDCKNWVDDIDECDEYEDSK